MPALLILLKLLGIIAVLCGWGVLSSNLLERFAGLDRRGFGWFELAVLGLPAAYAYAALAAFGFHLYGFVNWLFALAGLAGFVMALAHRRPDFEPWSMLMSLCLAAATSLGTVHTATNYDAGLYYLQHTRMLQSEGLALGLANVHTRFGFNSSLAPLSSVFDGAVFGRDGLFLLGPAIFLLFAGAALEVAASGVRKRTLSAEHFMAFFATGVWLLLLNQTVFSWFALSPSGDLAAAAAVVYCPVALLALCASAQRGDAPGVRRYAILLPAAAAFAVTAKLAALPIILLLVFSSTALRMDRTAAKAGLAVFAGVLSLWTVYSVALSGCLVYPVSATCIAGLPWAPDDAAVDFAGTSIRSWARAPGQPVETAMRGWGWLAYWRKDMLPYRQFVFTLMYGLPFAAAFAVGVRLLLRRSAGVSGATSRAPLLGVALANLAGLAYWFFSAPDPRFGLGFLIGATATLLTCIVSADSSYAFESLPRLPLGALAAAPLLALLLYDAPGLAELSHQPALAWRNLPAPKTRLMINGEGLKIAVPLQGDQCWDVETLCSPELNPKLTRTSFLGRPAFTLRGQTSFFREGLRPGDAPPPAYTVTFSPRVGPEEQTDRGGKQFSVRWLMQRSEFVIRHDGAPQRVRVRFRVATYKTERHAWLEQEGRPQPARATLSKSFWEDGEMLVENTVTLHPGENSFAIVTDGSAVDVTPGRPVFLLLVGGVEVANAPEK